MKKQAYGTVGTFLNEQVLRAAHAIAEGDMYGPTFRAESIKRDERLGFHWTSFVVEQLEDYLSGRDQYPKFTDFAPVLLERLAGEVSEVHYQLSVTRAVLWSVFGLGAVAVVLIWRRRKVSNPC